jgi:NitT/TauT family transport system ATP-binding protein
MILVFQEYTKSLFPWRTVAGNVRFGLEQSNTPRREWSRAVQGALTLVGLGDFANEYPWRISGGMQQRVALARAIVHQPRVLLMDEPFGSLDAYTRYALEDQLLALSSSLTMTIVLVTHDIDEAVYMSDRVLVLSRRPATILEDRPIALSRPREQIETRSNASFGELRGAVHRLLQAGEINSCAR